MARDLVVQLAQTHVLAPRQHHRDERPQQLGKGVLVEPDQCPPRDAKMKLFTSAPRPANSRLVSGSGFSTNDRTARRPADGRAEGRIQPYSRSPSSPTMPSSTSGALGRRTARAAASSARRRTASEPTWWSTGRTSIRASRSRWSTMSRTGSRIPAAVPRLRGWTMTFSRGRSASVSLPETPVMLGDDHQDPRPGDDRGGAAQGPAQERLVAPERPVLFRDELARRAPRERRHPGPSPPASTTAQSWPVSGVPLSAS